MISKPFVKRFATLATVLAVVANVYIYTYPSIHPTECSWHCYDDNTGIGGIDQLSLWEKAVF